MTYDYQGEKSILLLLTKEWDEVRDEYMQLSRDVESSSEAAECIAAVYERCADELRKVLGMPPKYNNPPIEDDQGGAIDSLREKFAAQAHEAWSGWMRHLFEKCAHNTNGTSTVPVWAVENWERQMETPYADLSEEEKESDRKEADEYLAIYDAYAEGMASHVQAAREVAICSGKSLIDEDAGRYSVFCVESSDPGINWRIRLIDRKSLDRRVNPEESEEILFGLPDGTPVEVVIRVRK